MEIHIEKLTKLCRLCGNIIKFDKKRKIKEIKEYTKLVGHLSVNIENDKHEIHPINVCEKCRKILSYVDHCVKKNKEYKPTIKIYNFEPHHDSCKICYSNLSTVGRPKVLKQLNQYTNTSTMKIATPFLSPSPSSPENIMFELNKLKEHAEKLGFASIPTTDSISFIIFHKINIPFVQLRNLVTLNISKIGTWTVCVGNNEVSKNLLCFSKFPHQLTIPSGIMLLELCKKFIFCSGNSDFQELSQSRRKEGNKASFTDRNNKVIAFEVNDVICKVYGIPSTIRHNDCQLIVMESSVRCEACSRYRPNLFSLNWKLNSKTQISPEDKSAKVPHKFMNKSQLLSKLQTEKVKIKNLRIRNVKLEREIEKLIQEKGIVADDELDLAMSSIIQENSLSSLPEGSAIRLLFEQQLQQSSLKNSQQMRWHPLVIRWCLGIYHTSPSAYDFLKRSSFLKLPHKTTLLDYSIYTNPSVGFNPDVLARMYEELRIEHLDEHDKNVSLLFDEMKVQSELAYSKSTGKLIGFVEMDTLDREINKLAQSCSGKIQEREVATSALAFMARGVYSNFQFTFAYFATKSLTCEMIFPLAWNAVANLEMIGLKVRCFVCDGASSNRKFYKMHVSEEDGTSLPYFATNLCSQNRKIFFICDVPHLIKTVRNNWENSHGNRNSRNLIVSTTIISFL